MSAERIGKFVRVDLLYIGEGWQGDYDENDPEDERLLRFDIYFKEGEEWEALDGGSYCTQIPENTPQEIQNELVSYIYDEVVDQVEGGYMAREVCQRLSWIDPTWAEN